MARREEKRTSLRDRVRQRAEENKYTGGSSYLKLPEGMEYFKPKKGTHELDIIPYVVTSNRSVPDGPYGSMELQKGDEWYCRTIFVHRNIGADEKPYICLRTIKKPCPICEARAALSKNANASDEEIASLKPQTKDLFYVIDLAGDKKKILLFEFSYANFRKPLEEEIREGREEWGGFADIEGGYTIAARFTEEAFAGNKYLEVTRVDFTKRDAYSESILDDVVDLDDILIALPYDKLEKIFLDLGADDTPAEDDEPVKEERSSRSSREEKKEEPVKEERSSRTSREEKKEEPVKEERSTRTTRERTPPPEEKKASGKCPSGHAFGVDCDKKDECYKCPNETWEACRDEADKIGK